MIATYLIVTAAFMWLGYETNWMRVRLPIGKPPVIVIPPNPKYASYTAYNRIGNAKPNYGDKGIHQGNNFPVGYSPNGEPTYSIILSPGITDVLCGWKWLDQHCADLVDYQPKVEMVIGGVRYNMTIRQPSIIKDIMRVNKLTKKQKLAYH